MKYIVKWNYKSGLGMFIRDETVELAPDLAEKINRDSPGVLEIVQESITIPSTIDKKDRMVREPKKRRGG